MRASGGGRVCSCRVTPPVIDGRARGYLLTTLAAMNLSRTDRRKMTLFPTFMYFNSPDFIILSIVARLSRIYSAVSCFVKYSLSGMEGFYPKKAAQETP